MMELRQIVRDQKLINFDYKLKGFISEADDEKVEPKDAFAGKTNAGNSRYWYVKDGKYKAVVDPPKEGGWELANKKKAEEEKKGAERRDTSDDTPDDDIDFEIEDDLRDNINTELAFVGLKPSRKDKNVFVDDYGKEVMTIDSNGGSLLAVLSSPFCSLSNLVRLASAAVLNFSLYVEPLGPSFSFAS